MPLFHGRKVRSLYKGPIRPELNLVSLVWSDYEYFYSPLDGMLVHYRVTPSSKLGSTHLYTWVKIGTMRVPGLSQEHSAVPWLELKPGLLDLEYSALTIELQCLPNFFMKSQENEWMNRSLDRISYNPISLISDYLAHCRISRVWTADQTNSHGLLQIVSCSS